MNFGWNCCQHTFSAHNNKTQSSEWTRQSELKLNMVYLNIDNDSVGVTWVYQKFRISFDLKVNQRQHIFVDENFQNYKIT